MNTLKRLHLLPARIKSTSSVQDIMQAVTVYGDDLPNKDINDEEYARWKTKWIEIPLKNTLSDSLKHCCQQSLPNIFTLLKLFATLPLSSCSYEHSASAMR